MNTPIKISLAVVAALALFAIGRYTAPTKTVTETKIVTVEKIVTQQVVDTHTRIVDTTKPDGTRVVVTENTGHSSIDTIEQKASETATVKTIEAKSPSLYIGALAGLDVTNPANGFVYGAQVHKNIVGPFSLGLAAFTDKKVSVSVGMSF